MNNYILDTNVLLHDPMAFKHFRENHVIIPAIVLEELESKKKRMDKLGETARTFVRELMKIREESGKKLGEKIELPGGGSFSIEMNHQNFDGMGDFSDKSIKDNRILAVAKNIYDETKAAGQKTILISMDALMIAKADVLAKTLPEYLKAEKEGNKFDGLEAQLYKHDRLVEDSDSIHKGIHHIFVDAESISEFYRDGQIRIENIENRFTNDFFEGDFVVIKNELNPKSSAMGKIKDESGKQVITHFINTDAHFNHVTPRNAEQQMLAEALLDSQISLVCVRGEAGSGKTLLSVSACIEMMEQKGQYNYKKLLIARPIVGIGKDIGALPGELEEKLRPWMAPIYDNLEYYFKAENRNELENILAKKDFLEVQALTHIRGRSLPNQLIIIDEAQNLTPHEVKTIITRAGEGSKVILLGDTRQIDHAYLDEINNGLTYAIERMKPHKEVAVLKLEKTERSRLADLAVKSL
ncbi:PhoH family protein [Bacillus thuringiensis]|uniref:PIN domain-containing protein n=1 Tax=Bacillus thuringiensis TaxID=1428 RepID=A0A9X6WIN4_BACTU|nr:PhoH family protein [Bacillus thuringiensis]PFJ30260.1 hypothetical protein COJ15_31125 [Bacillus thuringiensis]